jgi:hypothetical protein
LAHDFAARGHVAVTRVQGFLRQAAALHNDRADSAKAILASLTSFSSSFRPRSNTGAARRATMRMATMRVAVPLYAERRGVSDKFI